MNSAGNQPEGQKYSFSSCYFFPSRWKAKVKASGTSEGRRPNTLPRLYLEFRPERSTADLGCYSFLDLQPVSGQFKASRNKEITAKAVFLFPKLWFSGGDTGGLGKRKQKLKLKLWKRPELLPGLIPSEAGPLKRLKFKLKSFT